MISHAITLNHSLSQRVGRPTFGESSMDEIIEVSVAYSELPVSFENVIPPKLHRFLVSTAVLSCQQTGSTRNNDRCYALSRIVSDLLAEGSQVASSGRSGRGIALVVDAG